MTATSFFESHPTQLYQRRLDLAPAIAAGFFVLAAACAPCRCDSEPTIPGTTSRFYSFDLVHEYPHDPDAFTEGLLYGGNDTLFESTGLYHKSSVREVQLQTGKNIDVLNGIAWDEEMCRLFVTEKLWPKLYEIKLHPVDGPSDGSVEMLCPKLLLKSSI